MSLHKSQNTWHFSLTLKHRMKLHQN